MTLHNISQDYFGVTTNLMTLLKSYVVAKKIGVELIVYNDTLIPLSINSDIELRISPDFFSGISVETFRALKNDTSNRFDTFILSRFLSKTGRTGTLTRVVPETLSADSGDTLLFYEWFPKVYPVQTDTIDLKISVGEQPNISENITTFHVKNKSLLNVDVDIEITDFVIERYVKEFKPKSLIFVGGCKQMVDFFSNKYSTPQITRNHYRPLYHREKGDMKSVLDDIWLCSKTNFVTNDFLHRKYYGEIREKYSGIPNETCFFNSIRYNKHIFDKDIFMSNYFDMFVVLQKKFNFLAQ